MNMAMIEELHREMQRDVLNKSISDVLRTSSHDTDQGKKRKRETWWV